MPPFGQGRVGGFPGRGRGGASSSSMFSFDDRPASLFEVVTHIRICVYIVLNTPVLIPSYPGTNTLVPRY